MKKILFFTGCVFFLNYQAQVGIKTTTPVGALDINGDLNVAKELRTGGTNAVKGSAGTAGTIFHNSSGITANDWKNIRIADGQGSMSLFFMNTVSDKTGAVFSGANGSTSPYAENSALTNAWTVLPGTTDTYSVTNTTNKVVFSFQTTAQKTANAASSTGFACGIFVDDRLKAVRTDVLIGTDGSYKIFNLNATLTNVTPQNNYVVKVACTKRNLNNGTLGIGTAVNTNYLNSDMAQSVLTTSVLQPY